jgi:hypothetical protein
LDKEIAMNFETRVIKTITPCLAANEKAEFFKDSGCLFLECGLASLSKVVRALAKMKVGNFKVNSVGGEFAIDFL